jgi:hypothetical protein
MKRPVIQDKSGYLGLFQDNFEGEGMEFTICDFGSAIWKKAYLGFSTG